MNFDDTVIEELRARAVQAAGNSWSPYSRFRVGAAVASKTGKIYAGCNVENASFGLTQCAERAALTAAITGGEPPGSIMLLLLYTPGQTAHSPCGACRQVMHELMAADAAVVSCCDGSQSVSWSGSDYLPDPFTPPDSWQQP